MEPKSWGQEKDEPQEKPRSKYEKPPTARRTPDITQDSLFDNEEHMRAFKQTLRASLIGQGEDEGGTNYLTDSIVDLMIQNKQRGAGNGERVTTLDVGRLTRKMGRQLKANDVGGMDNVIATSRSAIALATTGGKYVKLIQTGEATTAEYGGHGEYRGRSYGSSSRKRKVSLETQHRRAR